MVAQDKARAVRLARGGATIQEIADALGISLQRLYRSRRADQAFDASLRAMIKNRQTVAAKKRPVPLFSGFPATDEEVFRRAKLIREMHSNSAAPLGSGARI